MSKQMAEILREAIKESGISILALSKLCGVPQPRLFHFMAGKDIRISTAQKLCDHFGLVLVPPPKKGKPKQDS
jgi:predicted transcriptional regulator